MPERRLVLAVQGQIPTCHVAMLQEPQKVADVITEAANNAIRRPPN
jgi:hypothetical protein